MKNKILRSLLFVFMTYGSLPALAEPNDKEPGCNNDAELERCRSEELKREDEKLNLVYKELMMSIPVPNRQTKLREAERQWLQFVDKNCQFEASTYGDGSLHPILFTECRIRLFKARIAELTEQGNNFVHWK